ncbi:MAG: glycosyltransferase family 4 protein [Spirochaetota bacterium]
MKILFLTRQFPPRLGGVATASFRLSKSLQSRGHEIIVLACNKKDHTPAYLSEIHKRIYKGIVVYDIAEKLLQRDGYGLCLQLVYDLLKSFSPCLIHSYYIFPISYFGQLLARNLSIPHISSCRGSDITLHALTKPGVVSHTLQAVQKNTTVSCSFLHWIEIVTGKGNSIFVANSIGDDFTCTSNKDVVYYKKKYALGKDTKVFVSNAVYRWKKGPEYLKTILAALAKSDLADLVFFLIGNFSLGLQKEFEQVFCIPEKGRCRRLIAILQPERQELACILQLADLFLLTSRREGMPNVLLEALAVGTAIAATNVDGVLDIFQGPKELGLLLDRFQLEPSAEKIIAFLKQIDRSQDIRKKWISANYSVNREVESYERIYEKVLQDWQSTGAS